MGFRRCNSSKYIRILKQARETLCSPVMQTGKIVRFLSSQKFGNNKFGNIQRRTFQLPEIVHPTVKLGNSIRTTSSTSSMSSSNEYELNSSTILCNPRKRDRKSIYWEIL